MSLWCKTWSLLLSKANGYIRHRKVWRIIIYILHNIQASDRTDWKCIWRHHWGIQLIHKKQEIKPPEMMYFILFIFTQDSLFSAYCTVINEDPAIEVLIVCKAPIWATEFTPLNQTTPKESSSVRIPCGFEFTSFRRFRL